MYITRFKLLHFGKLFGVHLWMSKFVPVLACVLLFLLRDNAHVFQTGFVLLSAILISVVVHEVGHILSARWVGYRPLSMIITPLGGLARARFINPTPVKTLLFVLGGPVFNLVLAAILYLIPNQGQFHNHVMLLNFFLGVGNLIPILPLDGGHIVRCLCEYFHIHIKYSFLTSVLVAIAAMYLLKPNVVSLVFLGWFMGTNFLMYTQARKTN